jgi:hypothetical protein
MGLFSTSRPYIHLEFLLEGRLVIVEHRRRNRNRRFL